MTRLKLLLLLISLFTITLALDDAELQGSPIIENVTISSNKSSDIQKMMDDMAKQHEQLETHVKLFYALNRTFAGTWNQEGPTPLTQKKDGLLLFRLEFNEKLLQIQHEFNIQDGHYYDSPCSHLHTPALNSYTPSSFAQKHFDQNTSILRFQAFEQRFDSREFCMFMQGPYTTHKYHYLLEINMSEALNSDIEQEQWYKSFTLPANFSICTKPKHGPEEKFDCPEFTTYSVDLTYYSKHHILYQYIFFFFIVLIICILKIRITFQLIKKCAIEDTMSANKLSKLTIAIITIWDQCITAMIDQVTFQYSPNTMMMIYFIVRLVFIANIILLAEIYESSNRGRLQGCSRMGKCSAIIGLIIFFNYMAEIFIQYDFFKVLLAFSLVPQIIKNVKQSDLQAFQFQSQLFLSCCTYLVIIYYKGYEGNVLNMEPQPHVIYQIFVILAGQMMFLSLQKQCGPRFFLPKFLIALLPNEYGYLRKLHSNVQSSDLDSEEVCAICLQSIITPEGNHTAEAKAILDSLQLRSHVAVKTECKHLFHAICMVEWLRRKKDCPVCRTPISTGNQAEEGQNNNNDANDEVNNDDPLLNL